MIELAAITNHQLLRELLDRFTEAGQAGERDPSAAKGRRAIIALTNDLPPRLLSACRVAVESESVPADD